MIQFKKVEFNYNNSSFKSKIDITIPINHITLVLGNSGSGKSTFLKLFSGIKNISKGEIKYNNIVLNKKNIKDRGISYLFQDNNVFDHLTVFENMEIVNNSNDTQKINQMLKQTQIYQLKNQLASQLSGGQLQRLALSMRMIQNNKIFLFDEPFIGLDQYLKVEIIQLIKELWTKNKLSIFIVSHDFLLSMKYGQYVIFFDKGQIIFSGLLNDFLKSENKIIVEYINSYKKICWQKST